MISANEKTDVRAEPSQTIPATIAKLMKSTLILVIFALLGTFIPTANAIEIKRGVSIDQVIKAMNEKGYTK